MDAIWRHEHSTVEDSTVEYSTVRIFDSEEYSTVRKIRQWKKNCLGIIFGKIRMDWKRSPVVKVFKRP
jgi:hypothetical protein